MKIAALALANLALADASSTSGEIHGGAGDHQFSLAVQFPTGESLMATKDSSNADNLDITETLTETDKMQFPAETLTITPSWTAYEISKGALMDLFGTNSDGSTQPTFDRLEGGATPESFVTANGTIFTTWGSSIIDSIQCENFVGESASPTITMTINGVGTIANGTTKMDTKGYSYTLTDTVSAERKCGFTYTIVRPSYTVTAKECTDGSENSTDFPDWVECGYLQYGFDAIGDLIVPASSVSYSVTGYKPDEIMAMTFTSGVSHAINEVKPNLDLTGYSTRSMNNNDIIDASCDATLAVQESCKYDELCYFKFHVGPCTVTGGFSDSDDDIVVTPFSVSNGNAFDSAVTFPNYRLPSDSIAPLDNDNNGFMRLSEDVTDKEDTAMQLFFNNPNFAGQAPSSLWSYNGVTLHGPAQYRADDSNATEADGGVGIDWKGPVPPAGYGGTHSYEIIGYMKFNFAVLSTTSPLENSNATAVQTIAEPDGLKITASSYVRLTFSS